MRYNKYVKFIPWVGKSYNKEGFQGKKILILGDSHYCEKEKNRNEECKLHWEENGCKCSYNCMNERCYSMTEFLIRNEYLESRRNGGAMARHLHTILNFEKNLFNCTPTADASVDFWSRVIFYNYIQHSQHEPGTRRKTSPKEKEEYRQAFKEVLEVYKPNYIIVWSKMLFTKDWLPDGTSEIPDYTLKTESDGCVYEAPVRVFKTDDGKLIHALITQHPCCRYGNGKYQPKWHALLKEFLKLNV